MIYANSLEEIDVITTGLFFDKLSGVNGIPRGVITEIFGDESIGKSSLCLQAIASAQEQGLKCLWADSEWSYDVLYAKSLGVDNTKVGLIRERFAEDTLDKSKKRWKVESGIW